MVAEFCYKQRINTIYKNYVATSKTIANKRKQTTKENMDS